jgi:SpoVK/Ycf46/Vps4 family AAA+-type ATPase
MKVYKKVCIELTKEEKQVFQDFSRLIDELYQNDTSEETINEAFDDMGDLIDLEDFKRYLETLTDYFKIYG